MSLVITSHIRLNLRQQQSGLDKLREKRLIPETFRTTKEFPRCPLLVFGNNFC